MKPPPLYSRHFASVGPSIHQHLYLRNRWADCFHTCRDYSMDFFYWGAIDPTGDENGLFTPFAKFLNICLVTFFCFVHTPSLG